MKEESERLENVFNADEKLETSPKKIKITYQSAGFTVSKSGDN